LLLDKTDTETEARVTNAREKSVALSNTGSDHGQLTQCNIQAILSIAATHITIDSFETYRKNGADWPLPGRKVSGYKICVKCRSF